ncbi:MAG: carbon monoxide dehydrogenase [Clostridiales bacterium]|nr:carbon monoxide dehydrogenase [Clostridiales bacterium]
MMRVYDDIIRKTMSLLSSEKPREYAHDPSKMPAEGKKNELILRREAAFELGESNFPSLSYLLLTDNEELVSKDRILLFGKDLQEISGDCPFARISIVLTDDIGSQGEQGIYDIINEIDMKKYAVSPAGYMTRASHFSNREQVRVSKSAVKTGLSFEQVGNLFIKKYKENEHVKAVTVIFISLGHGPYDELLTLAKGSGEITKALNHIFEDSDLDCGACQWKPVCDETEGMKMLHSKMVKG